MIAAATQGDDPWLLFLEKEYLLKLCFLSDIAARHKLYRVAKISYWPSTKQHYANWEATLEPVHLNTLGEAFVADEDVVLGPRGMRLTKSGSLLGYIVAQYIDGDDEDPIRTQCVDLYIEDALPKYRAYLHRQNKVPTMFVTYLLSSNPALYCLLRPGLATLKPLLIAPPNKACCRNVTTSTSLPRISPSVRALRGDCTTTLPARRVSTCSRQGKVPWDEW
jgi:hypothetical protein